ncbi:MAG: O-antigen ligase family protein [Candidatus Eisenbacteria bacterium]|nr:O-antigen ligase family protein [Candidatus Eisenbacteria bacterium]
MSAAMRRGAATDGQRAPDGAAWSPAVILTATAVAATILVFVPGLFEQFETPKAEVVRIAGLAALAFAAARAVAGARARWIVLDLAVAAWLTVEALATLTSAAPAISVLGSVPQREGLLTSLGLTGLYVAARASARGVEGPRRVFDALLIAASLASLHALLQAAGLDPSPWHGTADYGAGAAYRRPFATLGHPNLMGLVAAAALPVAWWRVSARERASFAWWPVPALLTAAVTASLSRAAWLAALAGSAVAIALLVAAHGRDAIRRVRVPTALAVVALGAAALSLRATLTQRATEVVTGGSGASRLEIWRGAVAAWRARPWLGHGPDTFDLVFPRFQPVAYWRLEWSLAPFHAHSIVLHTLATRGVIGLIAVALVAVAGVAALVAAWRAGGAARARVPAAAGLLVALIAAGGFGALGIAGAAIAWITTGLIAGTVAGPPAPRPEPGAAPARWTALAAVAAALAWAIAEIAGSWWAGEARERMRPAPALAAVAAAKAEACAPWEDGYARMRAEALERAAQQAPDRAAALAEAERAARRAIALAPARALDHERLASVLAGSVAPGDSVAGRAALAELARAVTLAPSDGLAWIALARLELYVGRPAAACAAAERAVALYPDRAEPRAILADARRALGGAGAMR